MVVVVEGSQLHGLMASQDVKVDAVVSGGVGRCQGGRFVPALLVRRALDCDDSENRKLMKRHYSAGLTPITRSLSHY